jgi:hypothetical protein
MITALILINVKRDAVNATAQALLEIPSVAEVYSVTGMIWSPSCAWRSTTISRRSSPSA